MMGMTCGFLPFLCARPAAIWNCLGENWPLSVIVKAILIKSWWQAKSRKSRCRVFLQRAPCVAMKFTSWHSRSGNDGSDLRILDCFGARPAAIWNCLGENWPFSVIVKAILMKNWWQAKSRKSRRHVFLQWAPCVEMQFTSWHSRSGNDGGDLWILDRFRARPAAIWNCLGENWPFSVIVKAILMKNWWQAKSRKSRRHVFCNGPHV